MLQFMIEKLCSRIEEIRKLGQPLQLRQAYMCLTTDIITLYALNRSWNLLDSPDFSPFWLETIQATEAAGHLLKHFPFLLSTFRALPYSVVGMINPGMLMLLEWQNVSCSPNSTYKGNSMKIDSIFFF